LRQPERSTRVAGSRGRRGGASPERPHGLHPSKQVNRSLGRGRPLRLHARQAAPRARRQARQAGQLRRRQYGAIVSIRDERTAACGEFLFTISPARGMQAPRACRRPGHPSSCSTARRAPPASVRYPPGIAPKHRPGISDPNREPGHAPETPEWRARLAPTDGDGRVRSALKHARAALCGPCPPRACAAGGRDGQ
jgi:hypothetical protein